MKLAIFGVLACCLVLTNAASIVDPIDQSTKTLEDYAASLSEKAEQVSHEVEQKYDEVLVQPVVRVEASVQAIEERKEESEVCVEQQMADVQLIVENFESTLDVCAQTASANSASVAIDIVKLSTDVAYDTYSLAKGVQRCRQYTNSILKSTCYTKQLIKAKKLITKTKKAVNQINQSVDETLPQILVELEGCSVAAEESAFEQLETVNRNIDSCLVMLKH